MKHFLFSVHFIFVSITVSFSQQTPWQWVNPLPQGNLINGMWAVNQDTAFAVAEFGTILRTTNAGKTWQVLPSAAGYTEQLFATQFVSSTTGWVIGETGRIDGKSKNMKIAGQVVTRSTNGYVFQTEMVLYHSQKRKITSPARIKMTGPKDEDGAGFVLTGEKMTVVVDESQMTIESNVFAKREMKENKTLTIKSDQATFSGKNNEANFKGSVEIKYGDFVIHGPEAFFAYNPGSHFLNSIQVNGGIKVTGTDKVATSENLNIDLTKNLFRFVGRPKVVQNEDELMGDEILFLDGGKQVKVQKVRARVEKKK